MLDKNARILIVDDSMTTRRILKKYLGDGGYKNTDDAPDGAVALAKLLGSYPRFSIVFADWHMPNMSGLELLQKIRGNNEFKQIPFIMTTGERKKEEVEKAIRAGATSYIVKPFEPQTIYDVLNKVTSSPPPIEQQGDEEQEKLERARLESLSKK